MFGAEGGKNPAKLDGIVPQLISELREALARDAVRVIDLFREWDDDGSGEISKREFREAMPRLGLEVPRHVAPG